MEEQAEPIATWFVRELAGEPPFMSKRSLYGSFCYKKGWKISTTAKGNTSAVKTTGTDLEFIDVPSDQQPVSFMTFRKFWNRHYPKLQIQKPSKDVCGDCHKFYNRFKYRVDDVNGSETAETTTEGTQSSNRMMKQL